MFKDHFSGHAGDYARHRPDYPLELFRFLLGQVSRFELAWDCATGNGQAATALAGRFRRVLATDASERQIAHARAMDNVEYRVAEAERSGLPDGAVDLITVAQALHWFDLDRFYAEVRRVATPAGVLAVWAYDVCAIEPAIDPVLNAFYHDTMGPYWPAERQHVVHRYRDLPFPFEELPAPAFAMRAWWCVDRFLGYLGTWSAVRRCMAATGKDPLVPVARELRRLWGTGDREVRWPLCCKLARVRTRP